MSSTSSSSSNAIVTSSPDWLPKIKETIASLQTKSREEFFSILSSSFTSVPTSIQGRWIYITILLAVFAHHWSYEVTRMLIKQTAGRQLFEYVLRPFHPWFIKGDKVISSTSTTIELKPMPFGLLMRREGQTGFTFSLENEDFCQRLSILAAESVVSVMADELRLCPIPEWSSPNSSTAKEPPSLFTSSSPWERQSVFFGPSFFRNIGDVVSMYEDIISEQEEKKVTEEGTIRENQQQQHEAGIDEDDGILTKLSPADLSVFEMLPPCIRKLRMHEYRKGDHPDNLERLSILFFLTKFEKDRARLMELMKPFCPAGISADFVVRMESMLKKGEYSGGCSFIVSRRGCVYSNGSRDIEDCQMRCSESDPAVNGLRNFSPHSYFVRKKQARSTKNV